MQNKTPEGSRYVIQSLVHASQVLASFRSMGETVRLRDVVERTGMNKGMCFRLLYTLYRCGFLERVDGHQYRLVYGIHPNRRLRIGYNGLGQDSSFSREVLAGLLQAANDARLEVVAVDDRNDAKVALRNADYFVREQVHLVIEFQTHDAVAAAIASKYLEARIPVIAIDFPHPGATYFGANHYGAGLIGGRHLGRWAKKHWSGEVDEVLLIELTRAGPLPRTRIRGILAGLREVLRLPEHCLFSQVDGDGQFGTALDRVRKHLRSTVSKRILVGAANDPSALGALRAFDECGRSADCVVVGQNAEPEGRAELREPRTRLIGSVAHFPEKYGEGLVRLALELLARKPAPPAVFVKHQLVTPENVDHLYPNDTLMGVMRAGS